MTDIQAALGFSQLTRLNDYVVRRHAIANRYNQELAELPTTLPQQHEDAYSSYHLYVIRLNLKQIHKTHREIFEALRAQNIGVNLHYIPVYRQPYYHQVGDYRADSFPESERYYTEAISLPMYAGLTQAQQTTVIGAIRKPMIS